MEKNRYIFLVILSLVCILSISAISATDDSTSDTISTYENQESFLEENVKEDLTTNNGENNKALESPTDKTRLSEIPLNFKQLNETINGNDNDTIYLTNNYTYNSGSDSNFKNGILIERNLTVYGNGITINGNRMARIFNVSSDNLNVKFYNIIFTKGNGYEGGAILYGNAYNCTFTGNNATYGGAIAHGNAYNCTFIENTAINYIEYVTKGLGGAIAYGNATNCTFTGNNAEENGGAINKGNAYLSTFTQNTAQYGGAINNGDAYFSSFAQNTAQYGGTINNGSANYCTFYPLASEITANDVTTTYNENKDLIITLKDSNGNPIPKATITLTLDSAKKYTTDDNGQVKINVATLVPKTYNGKISYAGDIHYNKSSATVKVTVKKANPKIIASSASFKLNVKTKKYTITLKNNKNQVLKSAKVTLKVNGKTFTAKTNSKGKATFSITNLKKVGRYIAVITFPATSYYNKLTKKVKITVKK